MGVSGRLGAGSWVIGGPATSVGVTGRDGGCNTGIIGLVAIGGP